MTIDKETEGSAQGICVGDTVRVTMDAKSTYECEVHAVRPSDDRHVEVELDYQVDLGRGRFWVHDYRVKKVEAPHDDEAGDALPNSPAVSRTAIQREMLPEHRTILSLCDHTGIWSEPYRKAGYDVRQVDVKNGDDVRLLEYPGKVHGIIAQPPCTHFAGSGARWWAGKGEAAVLEGLQVVDACLRFVALCSPQWWVLENPVGRLSSWIGPHVMTFQPHEYAGWADDPDAEAYTKRTCLWGGHSLAPPNATWAINSAASCTSFRQATNGLRFAVSRRRVSRELSFPPTSSQRLLCSAHL